MRAHKKLLTTALGLILGLLFLLATFLLVRGFVMFRRADGILKAGKQRLDELYAHDPFPSDQNLADERQNLKVLDAELARLLASLSEGQIEPAEQGPAKFVTEFWEIRQRMMTKARDAGVEVADDFPFGFDRQMPGIPPLPQDVARLGQQLRVVEVLCGILCDARISELRDIGREEFESGAMPGAAAAAGIEEPLSPGPRAFEMRRTGGGRGSLNVFRADAGLIGPEQLYGKWHFVLQFTAKESALREVLNRLAEDGLFTVVTHMELSGDEKALTRVQTRRAAAREGERAEAGQPEEAVGRETRIVCGQDAPVGIKLDVDVYQFRKQLPADAQRRKEG